MNTDTDASTNNMQALRAVSGLLKDGADGYSRRQFVLSLALIIAASALAATVPILYKLVIDTFSGAAAAPAWLPPALLVGAYAAAQFLQRMLGELRGLAHGFGMQRLNRRLSHRLFDHVLHLPLRFHLERRTGAVGETLNQGLAGCQTLLQHFVFTLLPVLVEFLIVVAVLVHFDHAAYLGIFALSATAYTVAFWRGARAITQPARASSAAHIEAHAVLADSLLNHETVKYFTAEDSARQNYHTALLRKESTARDLLALRTRNSLVVSVIHALSLGASLGLAGHEALQGAMTAGDFVLINGYVLRLLQPVQTMGLALRDVAQALAHVHAMLAVLREPRETGAAAPAGASGPPELPGVRGELTFEHVGFAYRPGASVLRDISFHVPAGRTVAIVGASGSGKSSLIRLLFRLYAADTGRILLDGRDIAGLPLHALRRAIAVVPQDTVLLNNTIGRNIALGRSGATREEIGRAARIARLDELIAGLPLGYDTPVGERGLKLSGGERQRVAIARAVVKGARVLVFDEATAALDGRTEGEIQCSLLRDIKCTTLIIAHRLSTITHADRIMVLERGLLVETGPHEQLLESGGLYATMWKTRRIGL
jgi:ATP-binding cassette subfamily B protein